KSVLSYLAYLKIELNKMSNTQQEILKMLSNLPNNHFNDKTNFVDEEIDYFISPWPLQNHDSLEDMESKMRSDSNFRNKVVGELIRVGGKSLPDMLHKIMKKVFADSLLMGFTYHGLRNKYNFSNLLINKAIFDATRKSKFKNACDDDIALIIGKWLTTSKFRIK
ncbi:DUF4806 domain-containing protein, partial [Aphis craccivora]